MSRLEVKLDAFEGPLDLLLHLIQKNEIDIYDIPIAIIADQYLEYINQFSGMDMDALSEFLVMAATLLEIKSRMLLPSAVIELEEGIDPREELVNRLIEYKRFKRIAEDFKENEGFAEKYIFRMPEDKIISMFKAQQFSSLDDILEDITLDRLLKVFNETLRRRELKTDVIRSGFKSVKRDIYTVAEKMSHIVALFGKKKRLRFSEMFSKDSTRAEIVVTFLALLELVKQKSITISQESSFGEIAVKLLSKPDKFEVTNE